MDIENLLRRASAAPLGPLSFTFASAGEDSWTLTVTLSGRSGVIHAERDPTTEGLILYGHGDSTPSGPWVTDSMESDGLSEQRIWLHGDGLTPALLLNALAELMRIAPAERPEPVVPEPPLVIVPIRPPEEPPRPEPLPVSRPRAVPWQSFSADSTPEETDAAPTAEAVASESETPELASPGLEVEAGDVTGPEPVSAVAPAEPTLEPVVIPSVEPASPPPEASTGPMLEPVVIPGAAPASVTQPEPPPATSSPQPGPDADQPPAVGSEGNCRECGSPYEADHSFCTNCGARLN